MLQPKRKFIYDAKLFPEAFETVDGERGVKLSGLDETTSALDAESKHQIQQALDTLIAEVAKQYV